MSLADRLAQPLLQRVEQQLEESLLPHREQSAQLREAIESLQQARSELSASVAELTLWLASRSARFHADMTVHQAWARHPGVRVLFTRHHLPSCDTCAVGADETLQEAAFGYGIELDTLIEELNALLGD